MLCERISVGRPHLAMRFAIVKVFPEPVTPWRTSRLSPRFSPS